MPRVSVNGKTIHYWMGRSLPDEKRPVLVFIHGAGGNQFVWGFQKAFFEKRYVPILLDLPGHGESRGKGEEDIARYADHVRAFVDVLGLQDLFLVGHSMGGAIVQTLALKGNRSLRGIVLVGTATRLKVLPEILEGLKNRFEETVRKIVRFAYSRKASPELVETGIENLLRCPPEILYGDFWACDRFDVTEEVSKIEVPTLVLCGEEDQLTPLSRAQDLARRIQTSTLNTIPDSGHMVMMEAPRLFNEKVSAFVSEVMT